MGRGSNVGFKRTRVQSKEKGSDESDEEYTLGEDEEYDESDEYCSLDTDGSEEILADFEEDEEEETNVKRAVRSKLVQKCSRQMKRNQVKRSQIKRRVLPKVEDDEVEEKDDDYEVEDEDDQKCSRQRNMNQGKKPQRKRRVLPRMEDDEDEEKDDDYDVEDEDEDEYEDDQKCSRQRKMNQGKKPQRKRRIPPKVEDDEDEEKDDDYEVEDEDEYGDDQKCYRQRKMNQVKMPQREDDEKDDDYEVEDEDGYGDDQKCSRQRKRRVSPKVEDNEIEEKDDDYKVEDEDEDGDGDEDGDEDEEDDDDDDDDEEFILDESDCVDEEDEMPVMKKNKKVGKPHLEKRGLSKGKIMSRKSKVLKEPARQISRMNCRFTRNASSRKNAEVTKKSILIQEKSRNTNSRKKRRIQEDSDSDFINSVSDFEYTISEEEREQVREATKFCTNFNTNLRSSSSMKKLQAETVCPQRRRTRRKGKEKVVDMKNEEVIRHVCGICLSEEGKKTVRGSLDCCSHYFCFACIMEWSKVESRCPLCKQRFMTISKPARSITGLELRTVVIQVPERDQVYQPSEEELQGYLDPYENVICTECQQGGEDALMLLCDICDSPAHTFCVGLGREVPEGNWYCEGCRPAAFASLNPQNLSPIPDQRTNNISGPSSPFPRGIDLNEMYVPETPLTQETRIFSSFRRPMGDHHAPSQVSGSVASTVSGRRRLQLQINNILNNRMSQEHIRSNGLSASSSGVRVFGSQLDQGRALTPQRTTFAEIAAPLYNISEGRLEGNDFSLARNWSGRVQNQTSTSTVGSLEAEHGGFGMALVHEQLHPCTSRLNIGADASLSPYACREVSHFNIEMGQVQQMVRSHLKSLSRENELGNGTTFTDITRQCTHTILAACGLEHRASEVRQVQPSFVCNHLGMAGRGMSLMKNNCSYCFNLFVKDVVTQIRNCAIVIMRSGFAGGGFDLTVISRLSS